MTMMLGDWLAASCESAAGFERWLETVDPPLAGEVAEAAGSSGIDGATWARRAVADFSRYADEESWATLISRVRDSSEPGNACLAEMARFVFRERGRCGCGGST